MTLDLTKRHRESLEALRYECDYEDRRVGDDRNFVLWEQLTKSHGVKTRAELVAADYAIEGRNRWFGKVGYRITEAGREALKQPIPPKPPSRPLKIKPLPPRIGNAPSRLDPK